jgi:hypothetical protein
MKVGQEITQYTRMKVPFFRNRQLLLSIAHFTMWVNNIVGPDVHDVPGPTSNNIFCFPPRRTTDAPTRIIASKIHQNQHWWMPSVVITKVETCVSLSITVLLYVSRSQPGQKAHEFHLSMTNTKSKCGSIIIWITNTFFEKTSQES